MRKIQRQITPVILALFLMGCAGITVGNDPVVVAAETSTSVASDVFDTAFKDEALLRSQGKVPDSINTYFNYARKNAPQWLATARTLTTTYKNNRSSTNKANLQTATSVLDVAVQQINIYLAQVKQ
jgi:hypothetical protein